MKARLRAPVLLSAVLAAGALACSSSPQESATSGGGAAATTSATTDGGQGTGASGSGGGTTTGAGGASTTTGSGTDPCATALLCDDFEAYPPGGAPAGKWSVSTNKGTVTVDTSHARSGTRSVKIAADAAGGYRSAMMVVKDTGFLPTAGNSVYGRMMFWLDSAPTAAVHWTFIDGQGPVPGKGYHSLYRYGGQHPIVTNGTFVGSQMMANYDTPDSYQNPPVGPGSDCWLHSDAKPVPVGAWACAEWHFDGPSNAMQFWLDGVEVPDLAMTSTGQGCVHQDASYVWEAPSFERLDLGWESYQADDARVIWIDDVAIGTQRLGCPSGP